MKFVEIVRRTVKDVKYGSTKKGGNENEKGNGKGKAQMNGITFKNSCTLL